MPADEGRCQRLMREHPCPRALPKISETLWYVAHAFLDENLTVGLDRRWDYGENRYRLLGAVEGRVFVVIYTKRGSTIRIISARKANRREIREYEQNTVDD